jgi:hypothetical protein
MVMSWNPERKRNLEAKVIFTHLYDILDTYPNMSIMQLIEDLLSLKDNPMGQRYFITDSELLARIFDYETKVGYHTERVRRGD